jgi:hypothetical protein
MSIKRDGSIATPFVDHLKCGRLGIDTRMACGHIAPSFQRTAGGRHADLFQHRRVGPDPLIFALILFALTSLR